MICLPERNPLYPSLALSNSLPFLPPPLLGKFVSFIFAFVFFFAFCQAYNLHFLFLTTCINDLPAGAKSLVSLLRLLLPSVPFLPLPQFGTFTFFLTETKVSFPKASCCLFVLLIYNCWQQSGTNPINCFSIRQICQIPPNPNKFPTTWIFSILQWKKCFLFCSCVFFGLNFLTMTTDSHGH